MAYNRLQTMRDNIEAIRLALRLDVLKDLAAFLGREDAEVYLGYAEVGRDADGAHRYQHVAHGRRLAAEYLAKFLLNQS